VRGAASQLVQGLCAEFMEEPRRRSARPNGVHNDHRAVAGDEVEQGQAHFSRFADVNVRVTGQFALEFVDDMQANGIVSEDVVAETEEENARRRGPGAS
jgi:hypothetical protein